MRGSALRSQLFRAIGVVVLICVAFTIGVGLVLTHRAVKRATLSDLSHQVGLIHRLEGIRRKRLVEFGDWKVCASGWRLTHKAWVPFRSATAGCDDERGPQ